MTGACCRFLPRLMTPSRWIRGILQGRLLRKPRRSWPYTSSDRPATWTPSWRSPAGTTSRSWKMPRRRGPVQRQADRDHRRHGNLQFPAPQDDHRGRGWSGGHQRPAVVRTGRPLSRSRSAPEAHAGPGGPGRHAVFHGTQLSHERNDGGRDAGPSAEARHDPGGAACAEAGTSSSA